MAAALLNTVEVSPQNSCRTAAAGTTPWSGRVWGQRTQPTAHLLAPVGRGTHPYIPHTRARAQHGYTESPEEQGLVTRRAESWEHGVGADAP